MSEPVVRYELRPPAAVLTLNRPDRRNAISRAVISDLAHAVARARDEPAARCITLTGAGSSFCAGMDLAELSESIQRRTDTDDIWKDALSLATLYDLIYTLPKPTIAAVNGAAVAGGAGFVTVCDLAVGGPGAKFGYPEVPPRPVAAMGTPHLLR